MKTTQVSPKANSVQFKSLKFTPQVIKEYPDLVDELTKSKEMQALTEKQNIVIDKFATSIIVKLKKFIGSKETYINDSNFNLESAKNAIIDFSK